MAVGDIDDDAEREIIVTDDNHHIQAFDPTGEAIDASPWFTNRSFLYAGNRMTWGQFIRLIILGADGTRLHDIVLPGPGHNGNGHGAPAAPTIADLDGDGQLEILAQTFEHDMDIFTVPGSGGNCLLWTTAHGTAQREE